MSLNIKATNTSITPAIREFIEDKLGTLSKFFNPEDKIRVEIQVDKKRSKEPPFRAEIDIQPHGHYAEARGVDVYAAFDLVIPKMREQLSRKKDKQVSLRRRRKSIRV